MNLGTKFAQIVRKPQIKRRFSPSLFGNSSPFARASLLLMICMATAIVIPCLFISCSKAPRYEEAHLSIEPGKADFGTIQANDPIAFHDVSLAVKNLGKKNLVIETVELPEGFSYSITPRETIEGGDEAWIEITMDIRKVSDGLSETAYVLSNDPAQPRFPIPLVGTIIGKRTELKFEVRDEPDIEFDHKAVNLGFVGRHQTLEHYFEFRNVGKQPLKILAIETFCKCLSGMPSNPIVEPGDSATIVATLMAYKWKAIGFRKSLIIRTNDPDEPSISLTVVANIIDAIMLKPPEIILSNIQSGQPATAEAKLVQTAEGELAIKKIETSSPNISVTSAPLTGDEKGFLLTITVSPDMPEGKFDEFVTLYTSYESRSDDEPGASPRAQQYEDHSTTTLPVRGSVTGAISVTPRTVNFGSAAPGESLHRKLFVSSATSTFEIDSLSTDDDEFHASFSTIEPGQKYEITLEFNPGTVERHIEDTLTITTSHETITVPVFATVASNPE